MFARWFGVSRKIYNTTVDFYNRKDKTTVNWMEVAKNVLNELNYDYVKQVPYQIKKIAVKDCYKTFMNGCKKAKAERKPFTMSYRSRKTPKQSCYIPKSALSHNGIYHTIADKLKISEDHLLNNDYKDLRLVREYDRWYVTVPMELGDTRLQCSENQGMGDVVALDPGIRSFLTYFSENGYFGHACCEYETLLKLHLKIDKLLGRIAKETDKHKKWNLRRSVAKTRLRIRDLVDELHWKSINFLVRNFSVIILPTFETSGMVRRQGRKIRKSVVRSMSSFRFYDFAARLTMKCMEYGVTLIRSNESYTSKTNSFNGDIMDIGGKKSFLYDGIIVDRDINGARNILLRAMRDSSAND